MTRGAQAPDGCAVELAEGSWLLNPGSVGQPRDSDPRAAWLELDTGSPGRLFHRVSYEIDRGGPADPRKPVSRNTSPSAFTSANDSSARLAS